jgi:hypothetical protein
MEVLQALLAEGRSDEVIALFTKLVSRNSELEQRLAKILLGSRKNEGVSSAQLKLFFDALDERAEEAAGGKEAKAADEKLREAAGPRRQARRETDEAATPARPAPASAGASAAHRESDRRTSRRARLPKVRKRTHVYLLRSERNHRAHPC